MSTVNLYDVLNLEPTCTQKDIIESGVNGFLYESVEELVKKTIEIVNNENEMQKIQKQGLKTAKKFNYSSFKNDCKMVFNL